MKKNYLKMFLMLLSVSLAGCASIKDLKKDTLREDMDKIVQQSEQDLNAILPIVQVPISKKAFVISEPSVYKNKKNIVVSFNRTPFTVAIRSIARELNLNVLFDYEKKNIDGSIDNQMNRHPMQVNNNQTNTNNNNNSSEDQRKADKIHYFDREISIDFKGPVKELFDYLSSSTRYFYTIEGNSLTVRSKETFRVNIPSYPGILEKVSENIKALGGTEISYDDLSNNLSFTADYAAYRRIMDFATDIRDNMSLVTMRVILLNVRLTGQKNFGIDWTKLVFGYNHQRVPADKFGIPGTFSASTDSSGSTNSGSTGSSGTTTTTTATATATIGTSVGAIASATGANIYIEGAKFTLSTLLNFISNYGKSSLIQNVSLQTLSGKKAKLSAITETPYVSSVGLSTLSSTTASTTSSASTDKAKAGVELEITPSYTKRDGTLTIGMNIGIFGVNSMLKLSAGTLGEFSQPETSKKTVETTIRMSPSQTAIIGGLIFDKKNGQVSGLNDNTYLGNTTANSYEKEELVVLVKPQIYEFVPAVN
jgi:type II secretory pathway component GspD/PulD (secretin)